MNIHQKNILQIDVEDWYCDLDIDKWKNYEARVVASTEKILSMLKNSGNKATFFILGHVAEKFPELVKKIGKEGHEIASHGYFHRRITEQSREDFENDLKKSIKLIEKISGKKVKGYRAPQFTITKKTLWALDVLKKNGLEYDSSIFPVKTPMYGIPDFPPYPSRLSNSIVEIPLSVYEIPIVRKKIPIAGGFYMRAFPYFFIKYALKKINRNGNPAVCYLHPWELDPEKPKVKDLKWYHYYNLKSTERKFKKMLRDFKFISTEEWIKNAGYRG